MNRLRIALLILLLILSSIGCLLLAHPGIGIVMDSKGVVYYTDLTHVWKITTDGKCAIAVRDVHTHELYIDDADNIYGEHVWYKGEAIDEWAYYVWRLDPSGEVSKVVEADGFPENNTLSRNGEGQTYWAAKKDDGEVLMKTSADGQQRPYSDHLFDDIRWIFVPDNSAGIYAVDLLSIKKIDPNGQVHMLADNLKGRQAVFSGVRDMHYIMGMWTDELCNIYVAVFGDKCIKKITPDGEISEVYKSKIGWSPSGGLIDRLGNMWILEYSRTNKARVTKVTEDGTRTSFSS